MRDLHGWAQKGPSAARVDKVDTRWRSYVGEYCTSLEMAGFSLTLVKLDPELEDLLAAPAEIVLRIF